MHTCITLYQSFDILVCPIQGQLIYPRTLFDELNKEIPVWTKEIIKIAKKGFWWGNVGTFITWFISRKKYKF